MTWSTAEVLGLAAAAAAAGLLLALWVRLGRLARNQGELARRVGETLETRHLEMLRDLNAGLNGLGDRLSSGAGERAGQLRAAVEGQLRQTRDALVALQISNNQELASNREALVAHLAEHRGAVLEGMGRLRTEVLQQSLAALAEQGRMQAETLQDGMRALSQQLTASVEALARTADTRLEQIQGRVDDRLDQGFKKTHETFTDVIARLATIDEAQRKIDGLTSNVVSLQELLGDKRSRGAFGEVQLEHLVRNLLPPNTYEFQHTLSNRHRADCVLLLPEPTGKVAVDSKFPLENYHRMFDAELPEPERREARKAFRADVRRHADDIADRYIVEHETSGGAVMFVPAEAVFAEIHAHHGEVVDHAMQRRVWIVSPTTMMAVLNTARAVVRDVETRRQVHVIKDELGKLGRDFGRFEERMRKLAGHLRQANADAEDVKASSDKIVKRFQQIERVELDVPGPLAELDRSLATPAAPGPESSAD